MQNSYYTVITETSGVTTMGSDRENPGAPNPNGGPQAITYRATIHQNSVKSFPKVQEMAFQRV